MRGGESGTGWDPAAVSGALDHLVLEGNLGGGEVVDCVYWLGLAGLVMLVGWGWYKIEDWWSSR